MTLSKSILPGNCRRALYLTTLLALTGNANDLDAVKTFRDNTRNAEIILSNPFSGEMPEKLASGYLLEKNAGRNGTPALVYRRTDSRRYAVQGFALPRLRKDAVYEAEVWALGENLKPGEDKNLGGICIQFNKDGKYYSGVYPSFGNLSGRSWKKLSTRFSVKPGTDTVSVILYLRKGYTGKISFSDLTVREAGSNADAIILNRPDRLTVRGERAKFQFTVSTRESVDPRLWITLNNAGQTREFLLKKNHDGVFTLEAASLRKGGISVLARLADRKSRTLICSEHFQLNCIGEERKPGGAAEIDHANRLLVDGRPFLPIGLFIGGIRPEDLRRIADAGFNTILPYTSMGLRIGGKDTRRIGELRKSLDQIQAHNLKIIFSLKDQYPGKKAAKTQMDGQKGIENVTAAVVKGLRGHPALLAWYNSDEDTLGEMPRLLAMRRLISSLDPWHPVYALTFRSEDFPSFARAGDISGVDSYPIRDQESRSMKPVLDLLKAATRSGNPVWAVPQIFHAGVYRAKNSREFAQYRAPTLEEIRAMTLLCLVQGARGIIFYHYADLFGRGEKFAPGSAPKEWAKVAEVVKDLKRVEPFVMSGISPEKIRFEQNFQVEGMLFRDGKGGAALILCGIGPGENRALFANPAIMEPESLYGLTKKRPDGKYEFKGNDIISDILIYQGKDPRP